MLIVIVSPQLLVVTPVFATINPKDSSIPEILAPSKLRADMHIENQWMSTVIL